MAPESPAGVDVVVEVLLMESWMRLVRLWVRFGLCSMSRLNRRLRLNRRSH
ncbi:hypothetical protein HanRHA438_Chr17g0827281 [Helianthus annuus]|nr:hypothetical protein HanIR_Chr17g0886941 [Helianthus annuus]KAJ0827564.1 hypothetical protein HanRHA438_Chr17g0827281 [Helianthus annuus]